MRQEMSEDKFGEIQHIYKTDFIREVSDASKDIWVVAFLYKESYVSVMSKSFRVVSLFGCFFAIVHTVGTTAKV